ncbi:MAG: hypothetical protein IT440_02790 [Phycisphaeraceae bacterium]|nr:hypothetical protein [Phycisphaeraceae bacterium]
MDWHVADGERGYLRELAHRQAEIASLPVMARRKKMWYDLNDGVAGARPAVIIETWTFGDEFVPHALLQCTTDAGRAIERRLLDVIRNHEQIDDDKVAPDTFDIGWQVDIDEFGVRIDTEHAADAEGRNIGFQIDYPLKNLRTDLDLLKPAVCRVDRQATAAYRQCVEDLLGDILPVRMVGGCYGNAMLTNRLVHLMGMENFFLAMYDTPEEVHRLMAYLRDNCLRVMRWAEAEGLLVANNANDISFGSSYNFTRRLPDGVPGRPHRLGDMWGSANSQETVGISRELFHEFCFPYYRDAVEPVGLLYYGCCEPTHTFWDDIRQLPHLKKISVNRWTDQAIIGEALRGTELVLSRKPDPNLLGVAEVLDEDAWSRHIRQTLRDGRGCFIEFIVRDVYTVHHNLGKVKRAVELARGEIDRHAS